MPEQKPLPAPVEHAERQLRVAVQLIEGGGHALRHRGVDRVALVGTVQGDDQNAVPALGEDRGLGIGVHAANNVRSGSRSPRRTARSTSTLSIPRALASTRACGLIACATRIPRQAVNAGSSRIRSR